MDCGLIEKVLKRARSRSRNRLKMPWTKADNASRQRRCVTVGSDIRLKPHAQRRFLGFVDFKDAPSGAFGRFWSRSRLRSRASPALRSGREVRSLAALRALSLSASRSVALSLARRSMAGSGDFLAMSCKALFPDLLARAGSAPASRRSSSKGAILSLDFAPYLRERWCSGLLPSLSCKLGFAPAANRILAPWMLADPQAIISGVRVGPSS